MNKLLTLGVFVLCVLALMSQHKQLAMAVVLITAASTGLALIRGR